MMQIIRDRRTFILLIVIPILLLTLADLLFESDTEKLMISVVDNDQGFSIPGSGNLSLSDAILEALEKSETFSYELIQSEDAEKVLERSSAKAVLVLPETFTTSFLQSGVLVLDLHLEGSNPALSGTIVGQLKGIAVSTLARLTVSEAVPGFTPPDMVGNRSDEALEEPVRIDTAFFYGGEDFGAMDYVAPVYIAFLVLFFVFLITCVSLIREKTHGTMERLLATPTSRVEIILGYVIGLGVYALMQGAVILLFSVFVLRIVYAGSLLLLFLVIFILAIVGVSLGMLASSFARNEYQVVQFIPLLIIPQMLLGGTFLPVEDLPRVLKPLAYCMPLTYANIALRDIMIKGWGFPKIYLNVLILFGFAALFILLDVIAVKREVD